MSKLLARPESPPDTHGWSFGTPFGATLSSSSAPKILDRFPFSHFAIPKSDSNVESVIMLLNCEGSRCILCLSQGWASRDREWVHSNLIVSNSFLPGHQVPAATILPPPGLTNGLHQLKILHNPSHSLELGYMLIKSSLSQKLGLLTHDLERNDECHDLPTERSQRTTSENSFSAGPWKWSGESSLGKEFRWIGHIPLLKLSFTL